ncbi:MAG: T9SS type A sorting domain-containing protein, partial [Ignavibacteriae bacterium]|nr:T9SS type A sorting domain-containing protein [Ignavibacteriota bacterium]
GIIEVKKYEKELNKIIYKFNNLSDKYPGTVTSLNSLREVVGCKRILGQSKSALEIVNKQEKTRGNSEIVSQIKLISLPLLLDEKDYEKALNLCDEIVRELPNSLEAPFMLLNKGMILEYFVEDKNKADEIYKELISRYPKSMYSNNAIELLGKDGEFERDNNKYSNEELFTTHDGFADIGSYPNPFNPSTTLNYYLQTASKVKLEVYDVMGRMIKSFTENSQASGSHKVVWDGTNSNGLRVATGIYIYRFEATSLETNEHFVKSEKLMLVK